MYTGRIIYTFGRQILNWVILLDTAYVTVLSYDETAVQMLSSFVVQIYFRPLTKAILFAASIQR
jgi:hypothetical protein